MSIKFRFNYIAQWTWLDMAAQCLMCGLVFRHFRIIGYITAFRKAGLSQSELQLEF